MFYSCMYFKVGGNMKKFNMNEFIWFLILVALTLSIGIMLYTGKIYMMIHPKMKIYLIIGTVILFFLSITELPKIFTVPDRSGVKKGNLIFVFAFIMIIIAGNINVNSTYLDFKGVNLFPYFDDHDIKEKHDHETEIPSGNIKLKEETFYCYLEDIQKEIHKYEGRDIEVEGMVYKNKDIKSNQFIITRLVMNCCAADSQYIGVICDYNGDSLKEGAWVRVIGKMTHSNISDIRGNNKIVPLITVNKIEAIKEPKEAFIYQKQ